MTIHCPRCGQAVPASSVNIVTDLAACKRCDDVFKLSLVVDDGPLSEPPPGVRFEELVDGFCACASTRGLGALLIVPLTMVISVVTFVPFYGHQIAARDFSLGLSLCGIPFLVCSLLLWWYALVAVAGKCSLSVRGENAELFVGVGPLGLRRRFRWSDVSSVSESPPGRAQILVLEGKRRIQFGTLVSDERLHYLMRALRRRLRATAPVERFRL